MKIYFVIGVPASGKSTYIKEHFPNAICFDLYNYQKGKRFMNIADIQQSYDDCLNDLITEIKRCQYYHLDQDIILEHTMLKKIRRKVYIDAVKLITDDPITAIKLNPDFETLKMQMKKRKVYIDDEDVNMYLSICEDPAIEEGFSEIKIIN